MSTPTLHSDKYKQAILFLCAKLGKEIRGKKKLAKLLYYLDFDFYEKTQEYLTGEEYKALPMGPFPAHLDEVVKSMTESGQLTVENIEEREGYLPTEVYRSNQAPDLKVFSKDELDMLNRVARKYGFLNGKQLEELTHAEAPYIGSKSKEIIPYELAFYRGTDFSNGA